MSKATHTYEQRGRQRDHTYVGRQREQGHDALLPHALLPRPAFSSYLQPADLLALCQLPRVIKVLLVGVRLGVLRELPHTHPDLPISAPRLQESPRDPVVPLPLPRLLERHGRAKVQHLEQQQRLLAQNSGVALENGNLLLPLRVCAPHPTQPPRQRAHGGNEPALLVRLPLLADTQRQDGLLLELRRAAVLLLTLPLHPVQVLAGRHVHHVDPDHGVHDDRIVNQVVHLRHENANHVVGSAAGVRFRQRLVARGG